MLTLVHGLESRLARRRVSQLQKEAAARGAFLREIDCENSSMEAVSQGLGAASLFAKETFLLVKDPMGIAGWEDEEVQSALLKAKSHHVVFFLSSQFKESEPLFQFVSKHGTVEEFGNLTVPQAKQWVKQEAEILGASFAPGADDALLALCGTDTERLFHETRKLAALKSIPSSAPITKEDVAFLVASSYEPKIFSTIDAMAAKDVRRATTLLAEHLKAGEPPLRLLSTFAWQFRILLSVKDLQERGVRQAEINRRLRLHPFVAQKSIRAASRFSFEELKELYRKLYDLDVSFKTSSQNAEQLLYLFFARAATKEKR